MAIRHMKEILQISPQFPTSFISFEHTAGGGSSNDMLPSLRTANATGYKPPSLWSLVDMSQPEKGNIKKDKVLQL